MHVSDILTNGITMIVLRVILINMLSGIEIRSAVVSKMLDSTWTMQIHTRCPMIRFFTMVRLYKEFDAFARLFAVLSKSIITIPVYGNDNAGQYSTGNILAKTRFNVFLCSFWNHNKTDFDSRAHFDRYTYETNHP